MSYIDDFQAVTWTSPQGRVFILKTLESGYSRKHMGEVKENPKTSGSSKKSKAKTTKKKTGGDSNDTFSDLGISGRDVTLDCYFIGENHHTNAENFTNSLCETGKSKLKLAYGNEFVVNVIKFDVKNNLTQNINCTIVNVQWHQTGAATYPASSKSQKKTIRNMAQAAKETIAENIEAAVSAIQSQTRLQAFAQSFSKMLNKISNVLDFANDLTLYSIMNDILGQNLTTGALTMTTQLGLVLYKAAALANKVKNLKSNLLSLSPGGSSSNAGTSSGGISGTSDVSASDTAKITNSGTLYGNWSNLISTLKSNSKSVSGKTELTQNEVDNLLINDAAASMAVIALAQTVIESASRKAHGVEVLYHPSSVKGVKMAKIMQEQLVKATGLTDRGIKARTDLHVLNRTKAPAILIETAFISNHNEELMLKNHPELFAGAIWEGIKIFKNQKLM